MLDINYIKENPAEVVERLAAKGKDAAEDIAKILELDTKRRALIAETEAIIGTFVSPSSRRVLPYTWEMPKGSMPTSITPK
jgi:seryl-tRNA synthetase